MTDPILPVPKKNWLVTSSYVPQPKGTPWYAINWGATICFFVLPVMFIIFIINGIVNLPHSQSDLKILFGKIIKIKDTSPHILIEMPDKKLKTIEFPNFFIIGKQYYFINEKESKLLINCNVEIRGIPMRFVLSNNRFRIFELICKDKNVTIGGLDESKKKLYSEFIDCIWFFLFFWFLIPVPMFVYVIYRERKFYCE